MLTFSKTAKLLFISSSQDTLLLCIFYRVIYEDTQRHWELNLRINIKTNFHKNISPKTLIFTTNRYFLQKQNISIEIDQILGSNLMHALFMLHFESVPKTKTIFCIIFKMAAV